jgi:hypothetical protein
LRLRIVAGYFRHGIGTGWPRMGPFGVDRGTILKCFITSSICLFLAWLGYSLIRQRRLQEQFDKLPLGIPQAQVLRSLGRPWKVEPCGMEFGAARNDGCVEYLYRDPFAPLVPRYYAVEFNGAGRMSDKFLWASP